MQVLNRFKSSKHCYYFLLLLLLNSLFVKSKKYSFPLSTFRNGDLKPLFINYTAFNENIISGCNYLIPSLFIPYFMVNKNFDITGLPDSEIESSIYSPILSDTNTVLYNYSLFTQYNLNLILSKDISYNDLIEENNCFFGLSRLGNCTKLNENEINLNKLMKNNNMTKKIFSFDKWNLGENEITSNLLLGIEHENFNSKNGVVGSCNIDEIDYYWGCTFKKMDFNNSIIDLTFTNGSFYKIYFSSESHKIIFPEDFKETFNKSTNYVCQESTDGLSCPTLFMNSKDYISLKLIDDNMIITTEIDNLKSFYPDNNAEDSYKIRITFQKIDYFVFPLIMFKKFLVQFDLEKKIISFFTEDNEILEIIKNEKKPEDSNVGKVFLIIFIIILIIALGFGVFWLIKIRRTSLEKNINKYNKFEEDDEVLKNMNEKRVF